MKAALYLRVSTDDKGQDPENQAIAMRQWASANGHAIVAEYTDRQSGSTPERTALGNMIRDAKRGRFSLLLFWALDRLTREGVFATHQYLQQLAEAGVKWRSHQEPYLETIGPFGDAVVSILAVCAKLERERMIERTRAGIARARAQGVRIGRPPKPISAKQLKAHRDRGLSMSEISKLMGVSRSRLYQVLSESSTVPHKI
jgi:DNA invertase Pin-like site-specific DNA recombinase